MCLYSQASESRDVSGRDGRGRPCLTGRLPSGPVNGNIGGQVSEHGLKEDAETQVDGKGLAWNEWCCHGKQYIIGDRGVGRGVCGCVCFGVKTVGRSFNSESRHLGWTAEASLGKPSGRDQERELVIQTRVLW
jgi:hypothetical protein